MSRFFDDALQVFETAAANPDEGAFGVLVDDAGGVRIVGAEGWRADALRAHYGGRAAFHIARGARGVRLTGDCRGARCVLETARPGARPAG